MAVTMKDVANLAGVSTATVSRVINGTAFVAPDVVSKINDAIDKLGYSPNVLGRGLRRSETKIILAIIPSAEHSFYNNILSGMQDEASRQGYDLLIGCSGDNMAAERRLLSMMENKIVDATVLLGTHMSADDLSGYNEKYNIALACERIPDAEVLTVTVDDEAAAYTAVDLIIKKGHKKIGLLTAAGTAVSALDRRQGYETALSDNGITYREEYIYMGTYDFSSGEKAYRYFSQLIDPPTAIFCISDLLAAAVIKGYAAQAAKSLSGGRYFKVCGFDNIAFSGLLTPGLTTVAQPAYEIGQTVIAKLIEKKIDPKANTEHIKMPFEIIERESL
jgi:LacI family transcriptional regulator/LacI family repressor for deo operon, udp, cdd, tsx, nupC, and nupG